MGRRKSEKNSMLPPRMLVRRRRKVAHYYYATPGSDRAEIPLGSDRKAAIARYHAINGEGTRAAVPTGTAKALHKSMVKNARVKGAPVLLSAVDVQTMLDEAGNACAVTGLQFDSTQYPGHRIRPWMPSIDRIAPGGPYSRENTRIVCAAVNLAMNQFGEATFLRIAVATVARNRLLRSGPKSLRSDEDDLQRKTPDVSGA